MAKKLKKKNNLELPDAIYMTVDPKADPGRTCTVLFKKVLSQNPKILPYNDRKMREIYGQI